MNLLYQNMAKLKEVAKIGVVIAMSAFTGIIMLLILYSDTPSDVVERFARFTYAVTMTIAPTSRAAVFIDLAAAIVGLVSASRLKDSILAAIVAFVAVYTFLALSINYLMAPV